VEVQIRQWFTRWTKREDYSTRATMELLKFILEAEKFGEKRAEKLVEITGTCHHNS